jgi:hypothetical protein
VANLLTERRLDVLVVVKGAIYPVVGVRRLVRPPAHVVKELTHSAGYEPSRAPALVWRRHNSIDQGGRFREDGQLLGVQRVERGCERVHAATFPFVQNLLPFCGR